MINVAKLVKNNCIIDNEMCINTSASCSIELKNWSFCLKLRLIGLWIVVNVVFLHR